MGRDSHGTPMHMPLHARRLVGHLAGATHASRRRCGAGSKPRTHDHKSEKEDEETARRFGASSTNDDSGETASLGQYEQGLTIAAVSSRSHSGDNYLDTYRSDGPGTQAVR